MSIVSLTLEHGVHADSSLYRLKRGTVLRLHPGTSLLGKNVAVYCNYPSGDLEFSRHLYTPLPWISRSGKMLPEHDQHFLTVSDLETHCQIPIEKSGTFHVYFIYKECAKRTHQGSLFVQGEPILKVGYPENSLNIPLDAVRCQTVLSKCLGSISSWPKKLRVAQESGYNLIHFTPIQELGSSRSCYSLRDQLKVNPDFRNREKSQSATGSTDVHFEDVDRILKVMRQEWNMASICDIVLNHTANDSPWIQAHPDGTYSCSTCPHLRPAFLLDALLSLAGKDVAKGLLETFGVPTEINSENHLQALRHQLLTVYLPKIKLEQLYQCDIEKYVAEFTEMIRRRPPPSNKHNQEDRSNEVIVKQDPSYKRLNCTVDLELANQVFNIFSPDCFDEDSRIRRCVERFRTRLEHLNNAKEREIQEHLNSGVENCLSGIRYERVQSDGPKYTEITIEHPVFQKYFTSGHIISHSIKDIEGMMYSEAGEFFMAHNGWVINGDPLKDFARPQQSTGNVYLRRELIAWGDSVKLRYGDKPEDSPYLWQHMEDYVKITAKLFDGVRLDNCHSTPLHVAEHLLDIARKVNPELYVVAELFTNSDHTDNIFVNRLGITSLIREALSAWDSHEQGRLVYRYGGAPVGAFFSNPKRPLAPAIAHALFMDLTHDNPSPVEKRSVFDLLPSAGLVAMACCATGSNRGYDELVPHHIHVVNEEREYQEWEVNVDKKSGIIAAKKALNNLHGELAVANFSQVYVDQMHPDVVAVTRHCPSSHQSVILVAHTAFSYPYENAAQTNLKPLSFEGTLVEIILEASISHKGGKPFARPSAYKKDERFINGLTEYEVHVKEHIDLSKSGIFHSVAKRDGNLTQLEFKNMRPGTVVAIRVSIDETVRNHATKLKALVSDLQNERETKNEELLSVVAQLNLLDINKILYQCDEESKDMGKGSGAYDIAVVGPLVYCGLQGVVSPLSEIAPNNDLGHPLCDNLRQGNWMIDYVHQRLAKYPGTKKFSEWLDSNMKSLKEIPRFLIPSYFEAIITGVYYVIVAHSTQIMSNFIKDGTSFVKDLSLATVQFMSVCESADLPKLSPNLIAPKAPTRCSTLSAGLPHFSTGYMRCWGRDTFIAFRGVLLLSGRFDEARLTILGFAGCLRHGLIPNLLDNGKNARFNCRDAVWWWLYCIKLYVEEAPNGKALLKDKVARLFPTDDSEAMPPGECDQILHEVIQEALQVHFQGLVYRERNAGTAIDAHMTDAGFNNQIGIHPETGFVFGGNEANCGTWMDKMGSSDKAGNRGRPTTPRDGSAVELVGLEMATLRFMEKMSSEGSVPNNSVTRTSKSGSKTTWTYKEWADKIKANFEKNFFVGSNDDPMANKKGIYKDSFGASQHWTDFQLRCNFPVAMVVAPELFDPKHAWEALNQAKKYLLGPLGMRTLDCEDWAFHGHYDNSNDSEDPKLSHGANYHQGPEWVWPIGFYLRARLIFARQNGLLDKTIAETWSVLSAHQKELSTSHWRGLPELTNENGEFCNDSCRTQAWSIATVLEVLYDLKKLESNN